MFKLRKEKIKNVLSHLCCKLKHICIVPWNLDESYRGAMAAAVNFCVYCYDAKIAKTTVNYIPVDQV